MNAPTTTTYPPALRSEPIEPAASAYPQAAAFIRAAYRRHYGATLAALPTRLFVLYDPDGELAGAAGVRPAGASALFLEHYLDVPVEAALLPVVGPVARERIVEVGSLAVRDAGQGRLLIRALTAFLHERAFDWAVFTAVGTLRNTFLRLGLCPQTLGVADPARAPDDGSDWGRYYDCHPLVMCCDVAASYRHLQGAGGAAAASRTAFHRLATADA